MNELYRNVLVHMYIVQHVCACVCAAYTRNSLKRANPRVSEVLQSCQMNVIYNLKSIYVIVVDNHDRFQRTKGFSLKILLALVLRCTTLITQREECVFFFVGFLL